MIMSRCFERAYFEVLLENNNVFLYNIFIYFFSLTTIFGWLFFHQVLIASAKPSDSNPNGSIVEAPLTVNIPNFQSCRELEQPSCSMEGTNVVVPVYVQKQPAPAATVADGLDKRKRKPWSEAEDLELIAAVQKCGEGNWAHMLRGDFKGDRTASQLSQVIPLSFLHTPAGWL